MKFTELVERCVVQSIKIAILVLNYERINDSTKFTEVVQCLALQSIKTGVSNEKVYRDELMGPSEVRHWSNR